MKKKRTWPTVLSAFTITFCLLLTAGGLVLVGMRSGRRLFGEAYEPVTLQHELPLDDENDTVFVWLTARLRVLLRVPMWETQCLEWILQ
ncbi:MAG: hypothetical protein IKU56_00585 [Clostridia bacterium]|nr:hypothetical protein [Clostridia bacterium]